MEDKQIQEEKIRKQWRFTKLFVLFVFGMILVGTLIRDVADNGSKDEVNEILMYGLIAYALLWVIGIVIVRAVRNRQDMKSNPEREKLIQYLNKVAPIPEHDANMSDREGREYRSKAFLNRILSAFSYYEKQYGRPLNSNDKNRIQKLVGIIAADHIPSAGEKIFGAIGETLQSIGNSIEQSVHTIDDELKINLVTEQCFLQKRIN